MNAPAVRAALVAIAGLSLGACSAYGPDGYGYSRVAVGYGSSYYSDPYYGWYDGYYYPGSGYYVWDRHGYRHRWSSRHQHYWHARRGHHGAHDNWSGYHYRRKGDRHAAPTHRYPDRHTGSQRHRDGDSHARDSSRHGGRHAVTPRHRGERPHAERPGRSREQRVERSRQGKGHGARGDWRDRREERHEHDD